MSFLSNQYWQNRYKEENTGWDLGKVSAPLKAYFDQLEDKSLKILIPGCGYAYEAEYLFNAGFKNVYVADFAQSALDRLKLKCPDFPDDQLLCEDFFKIKDSFDLIIEQTFFCALHPDLRPIYAKKINALLNKGGKLVGLLFNREFEKSPPFGGSTEEYKNLFSNIFCIEVMKSCYNSEAPRKNKELFINLKKV